MFNIVFRFGGNMTQTQTFVAHVITLVLIIGSAVALAVNGTIDGATSIAMIGTAAGITFGAVVTSNGANVATNAQTASTPAPTTSTTTNTTSTPAVMLVPPPTPPAS